jgi:hypothetical protein
MLCFLRVEPIEASSHSALTSQPVEGQFAISEIPFFFSLIHSSFNQENSQKLLSRDAKLLGRGRYGLILSITGYLSLTEQDDRGKAEVYAEFQRLQQKLPNFRSKIVNFGAPRNK